MYTRQVEIVDPTTKARTPVCISLDSLLHTTRSTTLVGYATSMLRT